MLTIHPFTTIEIMASSTETSPSSSSSSLLAQFQKNPEDLTPVRPKVEDFGPLPPSTSPHSPSHPLGPSVQEYHGPLPETYMEKESRMEEGTETPQSGNSPVTPAEGPVLSFADSFPSIFESLDIPLEISSSSPLSQELTDHKALGLHNLVTSSGEMEREDEKGGQKAFGIHHTQGIHEAYLGPQVPLDLSSLSSSLSTLENPPSLVPVSGALKNGVSDAPSTPVSGDERTIGLHSPPDSRTAHPTRSILKVPLSPSGSGGDGGGSFFSFASSSSSSSSSSPSSSSFRHGTNHGMAQPTARPSSPTSSLWKPREWFSLSNRSTSPSSPSSFSSFGGKGSLLSPLLRRSSSLRSSLSSMGNSSGRGTPPYSSSPSSLTAGHPSPPSSPRPSFTSIDSREETMPSPTPSAASLQTSTSSPSSLSKATSGFREDLVIPSKVLKRVRFPVKYMVQEYVFSPDAADRDDSTGFTLILEPSSSLRMGEGTGRPNDSKVNGSRGPMTHRGASSLNLDGASWEVCTVEEVINYYEEACHAREEPPNPEILRQLNKAEVRKGLQSLKAHGIPVEEGRRECRRRRRRRRRRPGDKEEDDLESPEETEEEEEEEEKRKPQRYRTSKEDTSIYLDTLKLNGITLDRHTSDILSDLLGLPCGLRRLEIGNCSLTNDSLKVLLHSLLLVDQVEELSLPGNDRLGTEGFKYVAIYVKKSRFLRFLDVSSTIPDRKAIKYLSHALMANEGSITELYLDDCCLGPSLLEPLVPAIRRSSLHSLSLVGNKMGIMGAAWMGALLRQRRIIKEKVSEGKTSTEDENPECTVTLEDPKLETLDVSGNDIKVR